MRLNFTRFAAIDGKAQDEEFKAKVDKSFYERYLPQESLPGKIGCYFSHLAVWKRLIKSGPPEGLQLEDDEIFHKDFNTVIDFALAGPEHWDLLKLNSTRAKLPIAQVTMGKYRLNAYLGAIYWKRILPSQGRNSTSLNPGPRRNEAGFQTRD